MEFWKLHGAGNDFLLVDDRSETLGDLPELAKAACDRHFGVGADGLMTVGNSDAADVAMHFFNADGSRAAMCGNGIRCFAKYVQDSGIIQDSSFTVETGDGVKQISVLSHREAASVISVDMGTAGELRDMNLYPFGVDAETVFMHCGVPHTILFLDRERAGLETSSENGFPEALIALTERFGPKIEKSSVFANGTNVNFVFSTGENRLLVSTWERGAGRTLACGTGACASAAAACKLGLTGPNVRVRMPGGEVTVTIADGGALTMKGEARLICRGSFYR